MKLVFALGNPEPRFDSTRHNIGFFVADEFARQQGVSFSEKAKFKAMIAEATIGGGKAIIALHSTASAKNEAGERERRSTILSVQPAGTVISLMRADIDYVVTEYGIASLRGASLRDRAAARIGIAHPDYREQLACEARKYSLL